MSIRQSSIRFAVLVMGVAALVGLRSSGAAAQAAHAHASANDSALIKVVRESTERFHDVGGAKQRATLQFGCVTGGESGAMGMHYVNGGLVGDGELDPTNPEIVIYEPHARRNA